MLKIARKAGAVVERNGSESEAWLQLPPETLVTRVGEMMDTQAAEMDYRLKVQATGLATGTYSFRLLDAAAPTLDLAGGNTQGSLNPSKSVQLFQFNEAVVGNVRSASARPPGRPMRLARRSRRSRRRWRVQAGPR